MSNNLIGKRFYYFNRTWQVSRWNGNTQNYLCHRVCKRTDKVNEKHIGSFSKRTIKQYLLVKTQLLKREETLIFEE